MKEIKITPPEGYEIDQENSTFECIKFKPKRLTYEKIAKELFETKETFWPTSYGEVSYNSCGVQEAYRDLTNCTSEKQAHKLLAINKLMNVAKYLNAGWKPDWNTTEPKYYIEIGVEYDTIETDSCTSYNSRICYFNSRELAEQAIEILGEDTIRLALSTDW